MDEAVTRRQAFDSALEDFLRPLGELEVKCDGLQDHGESKPAHIQERIETIRVSKWTCVVYVTCVLHFHQLDESINLLLEG